MSGGVVNWMRWPSRFQLHGCGNRRIKHRRKPLKSFKSLLPMKDLPAPGPGISHFGSPVRKSENHRFWGLLALAMNDSFTPCPCWKSKPLLQRC